MKGNKGWVGMDSIEICGGEAVISFPAPHALCVSIFG